MRILNLTIIFLIGIISVSFAQECYGPAKRNGMQLLRNKNWDQAIQTFYSAKRCPDRVPDDNIDDLIKRAMDEWVLNLQMLRDTAEKRRDQAIDLANRNDSLRKINYDRYVIAEANRIAFIVGLEAERTSSPETFALAYIGNELVSENPTPEVKKSLGDATQSVFSEKMNDDRNLKLRDLFLSPDKSYLVGYNNKFDIVIIDPKSGEEKNIFFFYLRIIDNHSYLG